MTTRELHVPGRHVDQLARVLHVDVVVRLHVGVELPALRLHPERLEEPLGREQVQRVVDGRLEALRFEQGLDTDFGSALVHGVAIFALAKIGSNAADFREGGAPALR
jgi:hypothetical protein